MQLDGAAREPRPAGVAPPPSQGTAGDRTPQGHQHQHAHRLTGARTRETGLGITQLHPRPKKCVTWPFKTPSIPLYAELF